MNNEQLWSGLMNIWRCAQLLIKTYNIHRGTRLEGQYKFSRNTTTSYKEYRQKIERLF